ncbi:MAG: LUD domain-containing protein [Candidatus Helarchaeota archaeon]
MIYKNYRDLVFRVDEEIKKRKDKKIRKKALEIIRCRQNELKKEMDIEKLKEEYIRIKSYSLKNMNKLKEQAKKRLKENGCKVYEVRNSNKVISIINEILKDTILVKSKTNVSKEINLVKKLEKQEINIIETDLGDRLIQLANKPAAHPILPSLSISKEEAYRLLTKKETPLDTEISIEKTIKIAREGLKEQILKAKVALTGANVITTEEGFIGLVENEGNQRLITSLSEKHIILTTIDKIVPTAQDAIIIMKASSYFGLGVRNAGYFSFIAGPSRTGDIESTICYGMHGPTEVHVIFVDNNRNKILNTEFNEILKCCSCGGCVNYCPIFEEIGSNSFGNFFAGGRGILLEFMTNGIEEAFNCGLNLCLTCKACTLSCPAEMEISNLIIKAREFAVKKNLIIPKHNEILNSIRNYNNPFNEPRSDRINWLKGNKGNLKLNKNKAKTLLFIGCMSSYRVQNQAISTWKLLKELNIAFEYLGENEPCCGGILYRLGFKEEFNKIMHNNIKILEKYDQIILLCPGCYSTFKNFYKNKLEHVNIKHIIEILRDYPLLNKFRTNKVVSYHDPCHLSRELSIIDPPRIVLNQIANFKELSADPKMSKCCGAGGGVLSAFPELSKSIASDRLKDIAKIKNLEYLLTTCPFCEYNLNLGNQIEKIPIKIQSIQEFIIKKK